MRRRRHGEGDPIDKEAVMRRITLSVAVLALVALLASAGTVRADERETQDLVIGSPPPCGDEEAVSLSAVDCAGVEPVEAIGPIAPEIEAAAAETARVETALVASEGPEALRRNCRFHAEVSLYTDSDWNRLAQNLAAQQSHCADYYISIPSIAGNKTMPRPDQAWRIRALGPRFHAMAEAHLTAWQTWVTTNRRTWLDAGKEFRRRMVTAGYDVALGDLWAMNEVPSSVRQNAGQSRRNLLDFLHGLYEGDASTGTAKGLVFVVGLGQRTQNLSVYLGNMRGWLSDAPFWTEADAYVRFWAQETYGDVRAWGVPSAPRMTKARHLVEYLMHPLNLARAGGERTTAAEAFFRRAYLPLANAAWKWQSGFGFTNVDHLLMRHFLSEQVHAIRHDAGTHPADGPTGRLGFAWAPENVPTEPDFPAKTAGLQQRLASAFANAYAQGGGSQMGACGEPGDHDWCEGAVDGAVFSEGWSVFSTWEEA
jgi:hypothetical protein